MTTDLIRYDLLVQDALRGVVKKVLTDTARDGVPGDHHYYVSFRTNAPGVRISNRLREKYPEEMTIVLQHQFWDLGVTEHTFEVGLAFGGIPERLLVPFMAVTGFVDPSVQFGLKFEVADTDADAMGHDKKPGNDVANPVAPAKPFTPAALLPAQPKPALPAQILPGGASEAAVTSIGSKGERPKPRSRPEAEAEKAPKEIDLKDEAPAKAAAARKTDKTDDAPPALDKATTKAGAEVVSLDAFRKKS